MVAPRLRSTSVRKKSRRTSTRKGVVHYKAKKPGFAECGICGNRLNAVPRLGRAGMRKLAKTEKRPERAFGGVLCHDCLSRVLKHKARLDSGSLKRDEVSLVDLKFIEMLKR